MTTPNNQPDVDPERYAYAQSQGADQAKMFAAVVLAAYPSLKIVAETYETNVAALLPSFMHFMTMAEVAGLSDVVQHHTHSKDDDDDRDEPWKR